MINKNLIKVLLVLIGITSVIAQNNGLMIIPRPQQINQTDETFSINRKAISLKCSDEVQKNLEPVLIEIELILNDEYNVNLVKEQNEDTELNIELLGETELNEQINNIPPDGKELFRKEGYVLEILEKKINIRAVNLTGLFYGLQSLKQLLIGNRANKKIDGFRIIDWPDYEFRGVMDDISRGPVPTLDFMKYQVRRMAELKYNRLMYYIEHVIKTEKHPEFAPVNGALTLDEIKELSEYAKMYKITLVGSFQSFGHFENILAHPKYAHLGERGKLLSPALEESYELLSDIYSEMIPAFDAKIFNANCDETFDLGKGYSKNLVDSLGYAEVYKRHILRIYEEVKKYNVQLMIWGDVVLSYPELLDELPKDIILAAWEYSEFVDVEKIITPLINKGYKVIVSPGVLNSNRLMPNYSVTFSNIAFFSSTPKKNILGMLLTVWDDGGFSFFNNDWYGVAYASDYVWSKSSYSIKKFDNNYNCVILGSSTNYYTDALRKFQEVKDLVPTYGMNDRILSTQIINEKDLEVFIPVDDWNEVKIITKEALYLLDKINSLRYPNDIKYLRFIVKSYQILADEKLLFNAFQSNINNIDFISSQSEIRSYFINLSSDLAKLSLRFQELKNKAQELWLNENRSYFLDSIKQKFDERIKRLNLINDSVLELISDIDSGIEVNLDSIPFHINILKGKYFTEWLATTPIIVADINEAETNLLHNIGVESDVKPKVTQEFDYNGITHRWGRIISDYEGINIISSDSSADARVYYLYATIDSPEELERIASIGTNCSIKIFMNGMPVYNNDRVGDFRFDEYQTDMKLNEGRNSLLIKLFTDKQKPLFSFKINDLRVVNRKNKFKIIGQ